MDINFLLGKSGLKSAGQELLQLEKDLEDILKVLEQIPQPQNVASSSADHILLHEDEPFNEASKEDILQNAKCVENGMFKIPN